MLDHRQSVKEVTRHLLFRLRIDGVLDILRRWKGRDTDHLKKRKLSDVFSDIYAKDIWVEYSDQVTRSGVGSTDAATREVSASLSKFLNDISCRKLVDIGCGDFNWMRRVAADIDYVGIDVVPSIIAKNNSKYGDARHLFICSDATSELIPTGDVAVCREVIFHLSFHDARRLLLNIAQSGFKYVVLTTDESVWFNSDIRSGDYRKMNLEISPFRLPPPLLRMMDDKVNIGRSLSVWPASSIRSAMGA